MIPLYFLLLVTVSFSVAIDSIEPFDFIEDALKYRNMSISPCEDFYRHTCSFNGPDNVPAAAFEDLLAYIKEVQKNAYWNHLKSHNEFKSFEARSALVDTTDAMAGFLSSAFQQICEKNKTLAAGLSEKVLMKIGGSNVNGIETGDETSCENLAAQSKQTLIDTLRENELNFVSFVMQIFSNNGLFQWKNVTEYNQKVRELVNLVASISAHTDVDDTPWVKNRNLVKKIEEITSQLSFHDNYAEDFVNSTNMLIKIEHRYVDCRAEYSFLENNDIFCYILTVVYEELPKEIVPTFFMNDNAFNSHPMMCFSFPNYYHTQYGREKAAILGYTGFTVGHEIGHSFFEDHKDLHTLPAFSENVENCVQTQYNSTCVYFKEKSCVTNEDFLNENGADIFGFQLSYELLKDTYGEKLGVSQKVIFWFISGNIQNNIERLQMTHEQLFFYAFALQFCKNRPSSVSLDQEWVGHYDPHSADNIRVNAVAQHPAFQSAFECSKTSKMMKSATEQCMIYGSEAPETRRKRRFQRVSSH
ncbi:hypothetical protein CAEBREN_09049 [Caenorhabditis brenneri]|uniref:Peptidase M13 C-terminal domain-containing protein n=1 Tax=Caenorhabditis brenneri TaxID=135651 RepID=G0NNC3_CAEBE|nr:hypothetical protein CAEBREN_09049 [Caenorhabditis brenneri]